MQPYMPTALGALALAAALAGQPAQAGAMRVTLTADQFALQTWALQPGATPSYTLRQGAGNHLLTRIMAVTGDPSVADQQESYVWQPLASQITHGDSLASASTEPPLGTASAHVSMVGNDGEWTHGSSRIYRFNEIVLAPQTGLTVSGRLQLVFDNSAGPQAAGWTSFVTCVRAFSGACDAGYDKWGDLSSYPQGYDQDFSFTMLNPGNAPLPMAWDIMLEANARAPQPIPEPAGWAMLTAGLMLVGRRWRLRAPRAL